MSKRFIVTEEEKKNILSKYKGLISEDEMMGVKQCTFTISELLQKNTQGLKLLPKNYTVRSVEGVPSLKVGDKVSSEQKITMGKGTLVFDVIPGFGQASINCDGMTAEMNVAWD